VRLNNQAAGAQRPRGAAQRSNAHEAKKGLKSFFFALHSAKNRSVNKEEERAFARSSSFFVSFVVSPV
jgi:hypothetical protein